jgi:UDP-glucose 4-epimerase
MKKVLITGGAGFIGSHIVDHLLAAGHRVTVIDNLSTGARANLDARARFVWGDICDARRVQEVVAKERPALVIHLAAQVNVRHSIADPTHDAQANIVGGINVLEACVRGGVGRIVIASSGGAVYGDQAKYPCSEKAEPHPASPYAIAKYALEHYCRYYAQSSGLEFVGLRLSNVYGPRQNPKGEAGVISIFLDEMTNGRTPLIFGDGKHTRDYVWVGDVAKAFVQALKAPGGVYNIATGTETSTLDLFRMVASLLGFKKNARHGPPVPGEVHRNSLDCSLARQRLRWTPTVNLKDGLEEFVRQLTAARPPLGEGHPEPSTIKPLLRT